MPTRSATPERPKRSRAWLGFAALIAGCSVCLLPGLLAGGLLGGVLGGMLAWLGGAGAWVAGGAGLLMGIGLIALFRARTGRENSSCSCGDAGCSCAAGSGGQSAS